nr:Uncharacterised protein [Klebsiella pneumoniae]
MGRLPDNLLIAATKPTSRSRRRFGRGCGGRMPCTKPRSAGLSFYTALQRRLFRVRETIAVILRGFIADGESGVVVRRADQPSKFASKPDICPHRIRYQNGRPGDTVAGSVSVSLTREAIGQAQ